MELSVQEFLDSVSNPRTRKGYRFGLKKFVEWVGKSAEELLAMRQEDLTQKTGENLIEYKNSARLLAKSSSIKIMARRKMREQPSGQITEKKVVLYWEYCVLFLQAARPRKLVKSLNGWA